MANRPQFPGMNPYLENPSLWPEVHAGLIGVLMRTLNRQIAPRYRAAMEQRAYLDVVTIIVPDTTVFEQTTMASLPAAVQPNSTYDPLGENSTASASTAVLSKPERVSLPVSEEVTERYLEIRDPRNNRVVTVVEVLSPKNKAAGKGRTQYLAKRQKVLSSGSHFVEIDLLRGGEAMPHSSTQSKHYQILVSRVEDRPIADRYGFNLSDPLPCFALPLDADATEPIIDLKALLTQVYDEALLDLAIDYSQLAVPSLKADDRDWLQALPRQL